eukprot:2499658-Rhodomonas_salina.4
MRRALRGSETNTAILAVGSSRAVVADPNVKSHCEYQAWRRDTEGYSTAGHGRRYRRSHAAYNMPYTSLHTTQLCSFRTSHAAVKRISGTICTVLAPSRYKLYSDCVSMHLISRCCSPARRLGRGGGACAALLPLLLRARHCGARDVTDAEMKSLAARYHRKRNEHLAVPHVPDVTARESSQVCAL